jgi:hypothetical protein
LRSTGSSSSSAVFPSRADFTTSSRVFLSSSFAVDDSAGAASARASGAGSLPGDGSGVVSSVDSSSGATVRLCRANAREHTIRHLQRSIDRCRFAQPLYCVGIGTIGGRPGPP